MCIHCMFSLLQRMDDFVEKQGTPGEPPCLLPASVITEGWAEELRAALHDEELFDPERTIVAVMEA